MDERMKELEEKLNQVCETYENDCSKCPYNKECDEYIRLFQDQPEQHTPGRTSPAGFSKLKFLAPRDKGRKKRI